MTKIMVTGSRSFQHPLMVFIALCNEFWDHTEYDPVYILQGECPTGADQYARVFAEALEDTYPDDFVLQHFPPDLRRYGSPHAFHQRNRAMAETNPDVCLAFYQKGEKNNGTKSAVSFALGAGVLVKKFGVQR